MLPRPLQLLVPLSALALLGWYWYAFRRKRSASLQVEENKMVRGGLAAPQRVCPTTDALSLDQQEVTRYGSDPTGRDKNVGHLQQGHVGSSSCSSNSDKNIELEVSDCSSLSSTVDEYVLCGPSPSDCSTSSRILRLLKGVRPEPEGGLSEAQALALLAEKPEAETEEGTASKGQLSFGTSDMDSTLTKTRTIRSKRHRTERQLLKELEQISSRLSKDVCASAEEMLASGDAVLKREHQEEPMGNPPSEVETVAQDYLQRDISKNRSLLVARKELHAPTAQQTDHTAPSGAVEEERCNQSTGPSTPKAEDDSGCSSSCQGPAAQDRLKLKEPAIQGEARSSLSEEDALSTRSVDFECKMQEIHHPGAGRIGKHCIQSTDSSKGANGVKCVNGEGGGGGGGDSGGTLWEVEVPAHLVGRLIGKQGKHLGFLKQNSGAKIYISTLPYTHEFQICHIEGSEVQVENALALIRKKFKDLDLSNRRSGSQPALLPSLPITSWLLLPQETTVEVIVPWVEAANYLFVQQHTHPSYYALCGLAEQMLFCYSRPGCPSLPAPVEAGVLCAAPSADGSWWRAQVIQHYKNSNNVQIRYVDYGGYVTVNLSELRQIRSDFVSLPFQASEVTLENLAPLPGREEFSLEAKEALEELTQGVALIIKVTGVQSGLPLVHMWRQAGEEMISVNGMLVERGLCSWLDSH